MDETSIAERVVRVLKNPFWNFPQPIEGNDRLVDDLKADSLDAVEVAMALEEEFGVEILDDEAERVITVADVIDLIRTKLAA